MMTWLLDGFAGGLAGHNLESSAGGALEKLRNNTVCDMLSMFFKKKICLKEVNFFKRNAA